MKVRIIPIEAVSQDVMENISDQLKEVYYPIIGGVGFGSGLSIPPEAYSLNREQHEAGIVLQYISSEASIPKEGKILGVTGEDREGSEALVEAKAKPEQRKVTHGQNNRVR